MLQAIKREIFPMLMKDEVEEREIGNNYRQERRWDTQYNTMQTHIYTICNEMGNNYRQERRWDT